MFESYITPYVMKFCSKVSVGQLCELITNGKDAYQSWLEEFSDGNKLPELAYLFQDMLKDEVKIVMAQVSPEHARVCDANPAWTDRQLDGLLNELLRPQGVS